MADEQKRHDPELDSALVEANEAFAVLRRQDASDAPCGGFDSIRKPVELNSGRLENSLAFVKKEEIEKRA